MKIKELEIFLKNTKYESFIGYISPVELKGYRYDNLFKMGNENSGYFAIKICKDDQKFVIDSIENMALIDDRDDLINKYRDSIEKNGFIGLVSDWLTGSQPIDDNIELLPLFFSMLAQFNTQNVVEGPYTSMYADGNYFDTIQDLLNWEINYHRNYIQDMAEIKNIEKLLKPLENGLSCIILEDMNPGNLFITANGKFKMIDTEWMIRGLNLYQFEKINYFGFEENCWYNITENSKDCYKAYFETLGIQSGEANEQIRAFELLQVLRNKL